jgi:hypothetical protein
MPRKKKVLDPAADAFASGEDPTEIASKELKRRLDQSGRILSVLSTAQNLFVALSANGRGGNESIKLAEGCIALAEVFEDASDRYREEKEKS